MATALYIIGFIVVIAGLAWAATLLGVPEIWIIIGVVIVSGVAIMSVARSFRGSEPPARPRE